jgi:hypothetical protein
MHFYMKLIRAHIKLHNQEDELVWVYKSSGGRYLTKLGYEEMVDMNGVCCPLVG